MRNKNHTENAERPKDVCCFHFNQILMVSLLQRHNTYLILIIPSLQAKAYLENPEAFAVAAAPTADATPAAGGAPAAEEKAEEAEESDDDMVSTHIPVISIKLPNEPCLGLRLVRLSYTLVHTPSHVMCCIDIAFHFFASHLRIFPWCDCVKLKIVSNSFLIQI